MSRASSSYCMLLLVLVQFCDMLCVCTVQGGWSKWLPVSGSVLRGWGWGGSLCTYTNMNLVVWLLLRASLRRQLCALFSAAASCVRSGLDGVSSRLVFLSFCDGR